MAKDNDTIICVMSVLRVINRDGSPIDLAERAYTFGDEPGEYLGLQTNEAPIRFLLEEAHNQHRDVNQIICLVSKECEDKTLPVALIEEFLPPDSDLRSNSHCSTEDFFCERTHHFCKGKGISAPTIEPVPYNPDKPSDSLATIAKYLGSGFRVSIDMTGGPRDAATLMTLAAEIVKFNSEDNATGPIVYSNQASAKIIDQRTTFGLVDLISAIDSFTEHGKADDICDFFAVDDDGAEWCTSETKAACEAMRSFADDIALCRVWNVGVKVMEVQNSLKKASESLSAKRERFDSASRALQRLGDPLEHGYSGSQDVIGELRGEGIAGLLDFEAEEALKDSLERVRVENTIARSELLFSYLIETIQGRFISNIESSEARTLGAVRWCNERQMVLQALAIFREGIADCLIKANHIGVDYVAYEKYKKGLGRNERPVDTVDVCNGCRLIERGGRVERVVLKNNSDYRKFATVSDGSNPLFIEAIAWYMVLRSHRNKAIHIIGNPMGDSERRAIRMVLGPSVDIDGNPSMSELQAYLTRAVECVESMLGETESSGDDGTSILKLLEEFSVQNQTRDVLWNDFREWCDTQKHFPITKQALGVNKKLTIPKWLEQRHPERISRSGTAERPVIHLSD